MRHNRDKGVLLGYNVPLTPTGAWESRTGQRDRLGLIKGCRLRDSLAVRKQHARSRKNSKMEAFSGLGSIMSKSISNFKRISMLARILRWIFGVKV